MQLTIKPYSKNSFPIGAVLIAHPSPKVWLQEMQMMGLSLHSVKAYAIPSDKANVLFGCLVVLENQKVTNIGKNQFLQCIDHKLFIPEYATIHPLVDHTEWEALLPESAYVLLPQTGLFQLNEPVHWPDLLVPPILKASSAKSPGNSVFIPDSIKSYRVEYDEEELLKEMEQPFSEEEMIDKLPFDMKKLLNGNQREMEKYLAFMEKNPELAMKYAIPLDTLNASRGNNLGKFSFGGGSFFSNFFGSNSIGGSSIASLITSKAAVVFLTVLSLLVIISIIFSQDSTPAAEAAKATRHMPTNTNKLVLLIFIIAVAVILLKLAFASRLSIEKYRTGKSVIVLLLLLGVALYAVLSPIYYNEGFDGIFTILILFVVIRILYHVFDSDKSFLHKKDEE